MKSRIFKYLHLLLDRHNEAIISTLINTNDQFKVRGLNSTTKTVRKERLIFLTFPEFVEVMEIYTKDTGDWGTTFTCGVDFATSYLIDLVQTPVANVFQSFWRRQTWFTYKTL